MDTDDRRARLHSGMGVLIGLTVMAVGAVFLLDNLGLMSARTVLRWWPAIFVLLGLQKMTQPRPCGWRGEGTIWVAIGTWLLLQQAGLLRLRFQDLWPALVILVGARLVWRGFHPRPVASVGDASDTSSVISATAIMGGTSRTSTSRDFRGGNLTAIMGGCKIDLTKAEMATGEAVLDVFALWGGIEVRVPDGWSINGRVIPVLGGFEDATEPVGEPRGTLVITGLALMGGVEVKTGPGKRRRREEPERVATDASDGFAQKG